MQSSIPVCSLGELVSHTCPVLSYISNCCSFRSRKTYWKGSQDCARHTTRATECPKEQSENLLGFDGTGVEPTTKAATRSCIIGSFTCQQQMHHFCMKCPKNAVFQWPHGPHATILVASHTHVCTNLETSGTASLSVSSSEISLSLNLVKAISSSCSCPLSCLWLRVWLQLWI